METSTLPVCGADLFPDGRCRLILIGKTGAGKSATGNTIIGKEVFKPAAGINSETKECGIATGQRNGLELLVMDTPGLCDTDGEDEIIAKRITQSLIAVAPGPHAILLVLRCDNRFTDEEYRAFEMLKDVFGSSMTSYLIAIFVRKDEIEGQDFQKEVAKSSRVSRVLAEANNRYVLFDNRADREEKTNQVEQLLQLVAQVVRQAQGPFFRHKMTTQVNHIFSHMIRDELQMRRRESAPELADEKSKAKFGIPKERLKTKPGNVTETPNKSAVTLTSNPPSSLHTEDDPKQEVDEEEEQETEERDVSMAKQDSLKRKEEMKELELRAPVRAKRDIFNRFSLELPDTQSSTEQFRKKRTSGNMQMYSPRNSSEHKLYVDDSKQDPSAEESYEYCEQNLPESLALPENKIPNTIFSETPSSAKDEKSTDDFVEPNPEDMQSLKEMTRDLALSDDPRQKTLDTATVDPKGNPEDMKSTDITENPADMDILWHRSFDESELEWELNQLLDDFKKELGPSGAGSSFIYQTSDKEVMDLNAKKKLVEDALRNKIINEPAKLSDVQKEQIDTTARSVGQKLKESMSKFALKKVEKCALM